MRPKKELWHWREKYQPPVKLTVLKLSMFAVIRLQQLR